MQSVGNNKIMNQKYILKRLHLTIIEFIIIFLKIPSYKNCVYTPKDVGAKNRYQTTTAEPTSFITTRNSFPVEM